MPWTCHVEGRRWENIYRPFTDTIRKGGTRVTHYWTAICERRLSRIPPHLQVDFETLELHSRRRSHTPNTHAGLHSPNKAIYLPVGGAAATAATRSL